MTNMSYSGFHEISADVMTRLTLAIPFMRPRSSFKRARYCHWSATGETNTVAGYDGFANSRTGLEVPEACPQTRLPLAGRLGLRGENYGFKVGCFRIPQ